MKFGVSFDQLKIRNRVTFQFPHDLILEDHIPMVDTIEIFLFLHCQNRTRVDMTLLQNPKIKIRHCAVCRISHETKEIVALKIRHNEKT